MKNRKFVAALLVIVVLLAAVPYFVGTMARDNIEEQAKQFSQMPGYVLKISNYDQGWFTSQATISFGFDRHTLNILAETSPEDQEIDQKTMKALKQGLVFDVTIFHGPVIFHDGVHFALLALSGTFKDIDHKAYKIFKEKSGIDNLLALSAIVSYDGATEITAHSPAFKADYSDISGHKMIIDSSGMNFQARIDAGIDHYGVNIQINRLGIAMKDGKVILDQMAIHADGDRINDYLWTGNGTTSLGEFSIYQPKKVSLSLNDFTSDYSLAREGGKALTIHITSNARTIIAGEVKVKDFQLDLDLKHLDMAAIGDYMKSVQEPYQLADGTAPTPEQTAANIEKIAARVGERLIKFSPELAVNNLKLKLNGGVLESDGVLSINGKGLKNIQQLSDPVALNKRLMSRVSLKFDKNMARAIIALNFRKRLSKADRERLTKKQLDQLVTARTTALLQNFVTQGYLRQEGDNYSTLFEMQNGQRMINGKSLPIPGM